MTLHQIPNTPMGRLRIRAEDLSGRLGFPVRIIRRHVKPGRRLLVAWQSLDDPTRFGFALQTTDVSKLPKMLQRAREVGRPLTQHSHPHALFLTGDMLADPKLAGPCSQVSGLEDAQVMAYNPGRRLIVRRGDEVIRIAERDLSGMITASQVLLDAGVPTLPVSPVDGSRSARRLCAVSSPFWGSGTLTTAADAVLAGSLIARLHAAGSSGRISARIGGLIPESARAIGEHVPAFAPRVGALTQRLKPLLVLLSSPTTIHGDLSADQILVNGAGEMRVIDLDRTGDGPIGADLGCWAATQRRAGHDKLVDAFVGGYVKAAEGTPLADELVGMDAGVAAWEARAHLAAALDGFRSESPSWASDLGECLDLADAAVERAEALLDAAHIPAVLRVDGQRYRVKRAWPARAGQIPLELTGSGMLRGGMLADGRVRLLPVGADPKLPDLEAASSAPGAQLLSHRPGVRAVVRTAEGTFIKLVRAGRAAPLVDALTAAAPFGKGFALPSVVRSGDSFVEFTAVAGTSLHEAERFTDEQWQRAWQNVTAAWQAAQDAPTADLPVHDAHREQQVLQQWLVRSAETDPLRHGERRAAVERSLTELAELAVDPPARHRLIHRDLHDKQLFAVPETGRVGLIDVDTVAAGDGALDLGNLLAHTLLREAQGLWPASRARTARSELAAAARRANIPAHHVPVYARAALARLACVYSFRPTHRALAADLPAIPLEDLL